MRTIGEDPRQLDLLPKLVGGAPDLRFLPENLLWKMLTDGELRAFQENHQFVLREIRSIIPEFPSTALEHIVHGAWGILTGEFRVRQEALEQYPGLFEVINSHKFHNAIDGRWTVDSKGQSCFIRPSYGHSGDTFEFELTGGLGPVDHLDSPAYRPFGDVIRQNIFKPLGIENASMQKSSVVHLKLRTSTPRTVVARYTVTRPSTWPQTGKYGLPGAVQLELQRLQYEEKSLRPVIINNHEYFVDKLQGYMVDEGVFFVEVVLRISGRQERD